MVRKKEVRFMRSQPMILPIVFPHSADRGRPEPAGLPGPFLQLLVVAQTVHDTRRDRTLIRFGVPRSK